MLGDRQASTPWRQRLLRTIRGKQYNLPFNMNTFYQMWGCLTPEEAKECYIWWQTCRIQIL